MKTKPTLHSHTHCQVAPTDTQTKTWQRVCLSNHTTDRKTDEEKEALGDNSTYKKLAVQWLNEVQYFNQTFVQVDSFVLRNRQLLVAANRQTV
jgi:hypothetical protein